MSQFLILGGTESRGSRQFSAINLETESIHPNAVVRHFCHFCPLSVVMDRRSFVCRISPDACSCSRLFLMRPANPQLRRRASTQLRSPTRTVAYPMKSPGESVVSITAGSVTLHNATLRDTIMAAYGLKTPYGQNIQMR